MKTIIAILLVLFAFNCIAQDKPSVDLHGEEYLFVELPDSAGSTVYRKYKKDCYIDLILTKDSHINGSVHFYAPGKVKDFQIAFYPDDREPLKEDWVIIVFDKSTVKKELKTGGFEFGIMDKNKFLDSSKIHKDFTLLLVYTTNDDITQTNEITIGQ